MNTRYLIRTDKPFQGYVQDVVNPDGTLGYSRLASVEDYSREIGARREDRRGIPQTTEGNIMTAQFIGPDDSLSVGQIGFLVEISNPVQQYERLELRDHPPHTNQSREPRLFGWCGSWNDTSTNALGLWRVVEIKANGRARIEELTGEERAAALDELGYPELLTECAA